MECIALEVKDLCVDYRPLKKTRIKDLFVKKTKDDVVHAVKNVSYTVSRGEILGVIGKNGSGKSTMLRTLAGIFRPDSGTIDLKGNSVSLLSLGVGFNNELSGRENIKLSGLLLGFSEKQIDERLESIIEFSEIGEHIENPVKTYSSGMHSKLAFSISVNLETDILLVDEVLSVGDERFKKKSKNRMKELILDESRTVVIVSHDLNSVLELCDRVLWLHDGETKMIGKTEDVINAYKEFMK